MSSDRRILTGGDLDFHQEHVGEVARQLEEQCWRRLRDAIGDQPCVSAAGVVNCVVDGLKVQGVFLRRARQLVVWG